MSKQSWKGSTLLNPEPPVLVSCGGLDKPNLITIGSTNATISRIMMYSLFFIFSKFDCKVINNS